MLPMPHTPQMTPMFSSLCSNLQDKFFHDKAAGNFTKRPMPLRDMLEEMGQRQSEQLSQLQKPVQDSSEQLEILLLALNGDEDARGQLRFIIQQQNQRRRSQVQLPRQVDTAACAMPPRLTCAFVSHLPAWELMMLSTLEAIFREASWGSCEHCTKSVWLCRCKPCI